MKKSEILNYYKENNIQIFEEFSYPVIIEETVYFVQLIDGKEYIWEYTTKQYEEFVENMLNNIVYDGYTKMHPFAAMGQKWKIDNPTDDEIYFYLDRQDMELCIKADSDLINKIGVLVEKLEYNY